MSEVDPPYVILGCATEGLLQREVALYLQRGYGLAGGVTIGKDGRFHQAVAKRPTATSAGEVRLRENKRK